MELWPGNDKTFKNKPQGILWGIIENKFVCKYFYQQEYGNDKKVRAKKYLQGT